ncbi:cellulase family glycosylhydrolase [Actinoplanes sp. NEAU-A12]|uniref:Cellulase family glycosylhydrolase n=1 Tax=Actinoplanes sandaracinus TaxID=3045177 RepID=A0ABT6WNM3_9ACTN|nr:cellulase family glycosylhydrolase [Actinoplanes sandaracinus]MDI6101340.1 cellulase family glycosylhydrolase [Actinoplanes sandaracinus]
MAATTSEPSPEVSALPVGSPAPVTARIASTATLESRLAAVTSARTINYYPSNAGWSAMWTAFDAGRIEEDMAKAAALGADNVRIIVFPQAFGYPTPKAEYAERLRKFISIADSQGLTVKLTLFDWWSGYSDAAGSAAWAQTVLTPYADDPRVLSVELKNEFVSTDPAAVAWVSALIPAVRSAVPQMPLTLSVDGQSGAAGLARIKASLVDTPLDYYDYHFYGNSERALAEIRRAQSAVSPDPIVIGETGLSTATSSEGEQAAFLARVYQAANVAGVRSVAPWTLYDFADGAIPTNSQVSKVPAQYRFGLYRADGSAKFAATVVRAAWQGTPMSEEVLDLGFEASPGSSPWRPYLADEGVAVRARDMGRTGTNSARFTGTTRTATTLPSVRTSPVTPVEAGQGWHAEAWARGLDVTGANEIALSWFDINDKWLGQNTSKRVVAGTTDWTLLTVDAVAPAGATSVQLHLKSGDNKGSVWFDDVALSPVPADGS